MDLEDILNGGDSDDDVINEAKALDLDQLLNEDSSDEEYEKSPSITVESIVTSKPAVGSPTTIHTSNVEDVELETSSVPNVQPLGDSALQDLVELGDISLTAENLSIYLSELGEAIQ